MKYKIHVDTEALKVSKPAILVVPENGSGKAEPHEHLGLRCTCGQIVATVEQHGNTAHVVTEYDTIVFTPPNGEPHE